MPKRRDGGTITTQPPDPINGGWPIIVFGGPIIMLRWPIIVLGSPIIMLGRPTIVL